MTASKDSSAPAADKEIKEMKNRVTALERRQDGLSKYVRTKVVGGLERVLSQFGINVDLNDDGKVGSIRLSAMLLTLFVSATIAFGGVIWQPYSNDTGTLGATNDSSGYAYLNVDYLAAGGDLAITGDITCDDLAAGGDISATDDIDATGDMSCNDMAIGNNATVATNLTVSGSLITGDEVGTVGAPTVTAVEYGDKAMKRVVITLADHVLEIDGSVAAGFGGTNIYTFAEGLVRIHTVVCDGFTLTPDAGDLETGEGGDFSIGSTQTADVTLDGTDVNFIASTSIDPIETATDVVNTTAFDLDGHTTAAAIYINALADDADVETISTNTLTAVITVTYSNLGDY